jgi:hypothetical protein
MSDTAINADATTAEADKLTPADLLDSLRELGQALPVNFQPTSHDSAAITAGLVYYLATGSLEAPRIEAPDEAATRLALAEQTRENELLAQIADLERQAKARDTPASPVAPAPVADVPTVPAETIPVATEPTPIVPSDPDAAIAQPTVPDTPAPAAPVDPVDVAPAETTSPATPVTPSTPTPTAPVEGEGGASS